MALHWDVSKVAKDVAWVGEVDKTLSPATEGLIWACMGVGLSGITEKNKEEFATRLAVYQGLFHGPHTSRLTRQDVMRHVGLSTNVSNESAAGWKKWVLESKWLEVMAVVRREARDAD